MLDVKVTYVTGFIFIVTNFFYEMLIGIPLGCEQI